MGRRHSGSGCFERALRRATALLALLLASELTRPACAYAAPLEVYGRLPHLENVALSPDGTRVAFVRTEGDTRVVGVIALAGGETLGRLRTGDEKVRRIDWADNDHVMITTTATSGLRGFLTSGMSEWRQLQIYDLNTHGSFLVPEPGKFSDLQLLTIILRAPMVRRLKDRTVLFVPGLAMQANVPVTALLRVDLESRAATLARRGKPGIGGSWIVDANGEVVAEETYDPLNSRWNISTNRAGQMRQALSGEDPFADPSDFPLLLGMGPVPGTVLLQRVEEGDAVWRLISINDGSIGPPMAERKILDRPIEDRLTDRMIGGVHIEDSDEYVFFDPALQQKWQAVLRAFHEERVWLESASAGLHKLIVRVEGERDGY
jgi:hypothetical protein